jgi:hypothetical protein
VTDSTSNTIAPSALNTLVIIQPDGSETREPYEGEEPTLEQLQKAVGGYVELVQVKFEGVDRIGFVNEDGKLDELVENERATAMYNAGSKIFDIICGPIAILVPTPLTLEQKAARAAPALARARAELGDDLGGYSVTDFLADNFTSWTLAECREVAGLVAVRS